MSLTVMIITIIAVLLNIPMIKHRNIGSYKVKNVIVTVYIFFVGIATILNLFTGNFDSLLVALGFVYVVSQENEVVISEYIYNSITLLLVSSACIFNIDTIWISFFFLALILFNHNRSNPVFPILSFALAIAPAFELIQILYVQWGALLIIPSLVGMISSFHTRDKFIYSGLITLILASTNFYSLGYSSIIMFGLALVLLFVKDYRNKKAFLYTMGLVPFIGINNPFNIIGIYISINVIFVYKIELLKIIDTLETDGGTIKNIKYLDIIMLFLGLYILAGGPGSPMSWLVQYSLKQKYLFFFFILLEFFEINKVSIVCAVEQAGRKVNFKGIDELSSVLYLLLMCIIYRNDIFNFGYASLCILSIFVVVLILYKKKRNWLYSLIEITDTFAVTCQKPNRSRCDLNQTLILRTKSTFSKLSISGVDETIIWSIFIFAISFLLIWRYL